MSWALYFFFNWRKWISERYIQSCACACESVLVRVYVCIERDAQISLTVQLMYFLTFENYTFSTIACFVYVITHPGDGKTLLPTEVSFLSLWWGRWGAWIDSLTRITQSGIVSQERDAREQVPCVSLTWIGLDVLRVSDWACVRCSFRDWLIIVCKSFLC